MTKPIDNQFYNINQFKVMICYETDISTQSIQLGKVSSERNEKIKHKFNELFKFETFGKRKFYVWNTKKVADFLKYVKSLPKYNKGIEIDKSLNMAELARQYGFKRTSLYWYYQKIDKTLSIPEQKQLLIKMKKISKQTGIINQKNREKMDKIKNIKSQIKSQISR